MSTRAPQPSSAPESTQTADALLEARRVTKSYDEDRATRGPSPKLVLDTIDLQIAAGEFIALLGPSGSGKSTLLRILAGLLQPTSGEVLFKAKPLRGPNPGVALVFQSFALFPWLTVLQNVELGLQAHELPRTQRLRRALAAIDLIGLDGFEDAYPKELSGGMRQRVGFARALVVEPELLFMDEPFSALDVLTAANLRKELLGLWRSRRIPTRAIVMVTHSIDDAVSMADRIVVLGANPGHVRVDLPGLPLEQRSAQSKTHTELVDRIYHIMTSPEEEIATLFASGALKGRTGRLVPARHYQVLPQAEIGDLTGLVELVHGAGDREDLYEIGRQLQLEVDDLLPLVDGLDLLSLADTEEGDLLLTPVGRRFADGDVQEKKTIFRAQALARIAILRQIMQALEAAPDHTAPETQFIEELRAYFSEDEAWAQLEVAVNWGRYAELFTYHEDSGVFELEEGEAAERA
jgi:NitT/TauT family transport system ATP-binding protein